MLVEGCGAKTGLTEVGGPGGEEQRNFRVSSASSLLPLTHSFAAQVFSLAVALPLGPAFPRTGGVDRARGEDAGLLDAGNRLQVGDS